MSRINRWLKFCPAKQITGQKKKVCVKQLMACPLIPKATNVLRTCWNLREHVEIYVNTRQSVRAGIDNINESSIRCLWYIGARKWIHKFWQTLNCNVQSLEIRGKLCVFFFMYGALGSRQVACHKQISWIGNQDIREAKRSSKNGNPSIKSK